jgi:heptosyltransferase-2
VQSWLIQTSFLGDAVLTLPLVDRILERGHRLRIIAAPRNKALFERAQKEGFKKYSHLLDVVVWDKKELRSPWSLRAFAKNLKKDFVPERIYCVHRSFSTSLLAYFSDAPERVGFSSGASNLLYTHCAPREWESSQHEIEKNLDLLRVFQKVESWNSRTAPSILGKKQTQKDVVAFSLNSPWGTKIWDLNEALKLMKQFVKEGKELWVLGDKTFVQSAEFLEKEVNSRLFKNYVAQTSIDEWVDLISKAEVLISGDSAAVHVANDLDVPTIALFGPTIPDFGFAPWRKHSKALGVELPCRPCDIHGPRECPYGHHRCMKDLKAEWVEGAAQEILGTKSL